MELENIDIDFHGDVNIDLERYLFFDDGPKYGRLNAIVLKKDPFRLKNKNMSAGPRRAIYFCGSMRAGR